jgi:hypothetical protein
MEEADPSGLFRCSHSDVLVAGGQYHTGTKVHSTNAVPARSYVALRARLSQWHSVSSSLVYISLATQLHRIVSESCLPSPIYKHDRFQISKESPF